MTSEQGAARGAALGAMNLKGMEGADFSPDPGARRRRARGGAEAIDERLRSESADATHGARGVSRERWEYA
jgi:hypothetical protein